MVAQQSHLDLPASGDPESVSGVLLYCIRDDARGSHASLRGGLHTAALLRQLHPGAAYSSYSSLPSSRRRPDGRDWTCRGQRGCCSHTQATATRIAICWRHKPHLLCCLAGRLGGALQGAQGCVGVSVHANSKCMRLTSGRITPWQQSGACWGCHLCLPPRAWQRQRLPWPPPPASEHQQQDLPGGGEGAKHTTHTQLQPPPITCSSPPAAMSLCMPMAPAIRFMGMPLPASASSLSMLAPRIFSSSCKNSGVVS